MNTGFGPDPYNMPPAGPAGNHQALQQFINQAAPLIPLSDFHGAQEGVPAPQAVSTQSVNTSTTSIRHNHAPMALLTLSLVFILVIIYWVIRKIFSNRKGRAL